MRKSLALLPAALLLASCGTADAEPTVEDTFTPEPTIEAPEPITLEGQTFEYTTLDGAKGVLTIPSAPIPDLEQYLTLVGDPKELTYATVDVDNRAGAAEYGVYEIHLYTPEGDVVTFENINNAVIGWDHDVPPEAVDLYYSLGDEGDVGVGERRDDHAVTAQPLPTEVTRIEVGQTGGGSVQVYPEVSEDQKSSAELQQEWADQQ